MASPLPALRSSQGAGPRARRPGCAKRRPRPRPRPRAWRGASGSTAGGLREHHTSWAPRRGPEAILRARRGARWLRGHEDEDGGAARTPRPTRERSARRERRPRRVPAARRPGRPSGTHDPARPRGERRTPSSPFPPPAGPLRRGRRRPRSLRALPLCEPRGGGCGDRGVGATPPSSAGCSEQGRGRRPCGPAGQCRYLGVWDRGGFALSPCPGNARRGADARFSLKPRGASRPRPPVPTVTGYDPERSDKPRAGVCRGPRCSPRGCG